MSSNKKLSLQEFVNTPLDSIVANQRVIIFSKTGDQPISLVQSCLFSYVKNQLKISLMMCDISTLSYQELCAQCDSAFLDQQIAYWLRGDIKTVGPTSFANYVNQYSGPNYLFVTQADNFLVNTKNKSSLVVVEIPDVVDGILYRQLMPLWSDRVMGETAIALMADLFVRYRKLPINMAAVFTQYALLMSPQNKRFFIDQYADRMVTLPRTLFSLAQYFFAADVTSFFAEWAKLHEWYPIPFWTSFWSEQVWRASAYVSLMESKQQDAAKIMAVRLPFSFIRSGWQKYTGERGKLKFARTHQELYEIDVRFKNGQYFHDLDRWYMHFLSASF